MVVLGGMEGYVIDPSSAGGAGAKMGFDATRGTGATFDRIALPAGAAARARTVAEKIFKGAS
jgi:2,5-furandicarboxylate decarboxylase 1